MRRLELAGAWIAGLCGLAHLWLHRGYTLDDAYITYRYARNLARGLGLVYNPGEYVKGYSNTLYTFLMSVPELFGRDPNPLSKGLGFAAFAVLAAAVWRLYAGGARDRALWALALLGSSSAVAVHCASGLETGMYTALVYTALVRRLHEQAEPNARPWSALWWSAAVLSRPEGILLFAANALHDAGIRLVRRRVARRDLVFFGAPLLVYALELGISYAYYGDAFPQTYYAKTRAAQGIVDALSQLRSELAAQLLSGSYLRLGLDGYAPVVPLLAALPFSLLVRERWRQNAALLLLVIAQLVFVARAHDDWAPAFRFGVPMLPAIACLVAELIGLVAAIARGYQRMVGWSLAFAVLGWTVPAQLAASLEVERVRYVNAEGKLAQGGYFATLAPAGITLSSFDIGGQGYAAGGFDILDTYGLTTRQTVGCNLRAPARCSRYAQLVLPELVRLHNNRKRDGYVGPAVQALAPYLALDGGKVLLQRALVLGGELPAWVEQRARIASDLPPALAAWQEHAVTVYWRRAEGDLDVVRERRFEWWSEQAKFTAHASGSVWKHAELGDWAEGELFADRVTVRTPPRVGRYQLQLVAGGKRTTVGESEVLPEAERRKRAEGWVKEGRALIAKGEVERGLYWYREAVQLGAAEAGQRACAEWASGVRKEAKAVAGADPLWALRMLQRAKRVLHEAAWLSGLAGVGRELRAEIDANAAARSAAIAADGRGGN